MIGSQFLVPKFFKCWFILRLYLSLYINIWNVCLLKFVKSSWFLILYSLNSLEHQINRNVQLKFSQNYFLNQVKSQNIITKDQKRSKPLDALHINIRQKHIPQTSRLHNTLSSRKHSPIYWKVYSKLFRLWINF